MDSQSAHCWTDRSDICCIVTAYGLIYLVIDKCDTFDNAREAGKDVASFIPDESIFLLLSLYLGILELYCRD